MYVAVAFSHASPYKFFLQASFLTSDAWRSLPSVKAVLTSPRVSILLQSVPNIAFTLVIADFGIIFTS
jgi:hypothetical protein